MDIESVCIIGGSGFVGRSIADQACARGYRVRVVTRSSNRARNLLVLPTVETMVADPNDEQSLESCLDNMDAVIDLVGILHERGRSTFRAAHVELPRKIAAACRREGVRQLLHMSALGASPSGPSDYLRSKGEGEAALREAADALPVTIFRPSVIFGEGDRFLNLFASLAKRLPVVALGGAAARFQPVWVEDVARCFVGALGESRAFGATYELCGPRVYTLEELVRFAMETSGHRRAIVKLPGALAQLQALLLEHLPGKLMTRDNLRSMSVDNVCPGPFPALFGFAPATMEAVVPRYLADSSGRARYDQYRHHAGR
jgi:NADH dehydrogenase